MGWFRHDAQKALPHFVRDSTCDPTLPHFGFTSSDDFCTREFRPCRRPVASPDDDAVIVNACESVPYTIARKVRRADRFWIKSRPYSLRHMFADDPVNEEFVGGTICLVLLSALN